MRYMDTLRPLREHAAVTRKRARSQGVHRVVQPEEARHRVLHWRRLRWLLLIQLSPARGTTLARSARDVISVQRLHIRAPSDPGIGGGTATTSSFLTGTAAEATTGALLPQLLTLLEHLGLAFRAGID